VIVNTSSIGIRNGFSVSRVGLRDVVVHGLHQLEDLGGLLLVALERLQRRAGDHRMSSPGNSYLESSSRTSISTSSSSSGVVDHVGLVQEHDDVRHLDLAREQDVLAGLRHRAVGGRDDEDRAVHLGGARDHVLDVVGVPGQSTCA
jgi:hypothetical protein